MTYDLVKRLRFPLSQLDGGPNDEELWDRIYTDREEAADRIEALEATLRKIAAIEDEHINAPKTDAEANLWAILAMCADLADAALEGEKKE